MQNIKTRFIVNTVLFFLIYALMFYVVTRTIYVDMTHDEAYSFYNVKHFWLVETLCTGNTHWFNFLAIKTAVLLGLEKTSQLRWFTVLSAGIYFTTSYFWIKSLKNNATKSFAFAIALLNPYVIDYLGLARGYASGLMFESLSILCYYISIKENKKNISLLALIFAGLAAIANFNFFYFFTAFNVLYFYKELAKRQFTIFKQKLFYFEITYSLIITWLVLRALKFITECSNDIGEYGGNTLINSIFEGMINSFFYGRLNEHTTNILAYVFFGIIIIATLHAVFFYKKHKTHWYQLSAVILLIMLGLTTFNKWTFNVLYPTYRTTLMFYPLISLLLVGFFSTVIHHLKTKTILMYSISVLILLNFLSTINIKKTFDYYHQEDSKASLDLLKKLGAKRVGLCGEIFGVYRNYYQITDNYQYPFTAERLNTDEIIRDTRFSDDILEDEYLVLFPPYNMSYYKGKAIKLKAVKYFQKSGTLIVKIND